MIGRLQRVPLREVWQHEALDFTTWAAAIANTLKTGVSWTFR